MRRTFGPFFRKHAAKKLWKAGPELLPARQQAATACPQPGKGTSEVTEGALRFTEIRKTRLRSRGGRFCPFAGSRATDFSPPPPHRKAARKAKKKPGDGTPRPSGPRKNAPGRKTVRAAVRYSPAHAPRSRRAPQSAGIFSAILRPRRRRANAGRSPHEQ